MVVTEAEVITCRKLKPTSIVFYYVSGPAGLAL